MTNRDRGMHQPYDDLPDIDWSTPAPLIPPLRPCERFDMPASSRVDWSTAPPTFSPSDSIGVLTMLAATLALSRHTNALVALPARSAGGSGCDADAKLAPEALHIVAQIDAFMGDLRDVVGASGTEGGEDDAGGVKGGGA